MHDQDAFSHADIINMSEGKGMNPDMPKLPRDNMLMFDRITCISQEGGTFGKGFMEAELDITPELWFFNCHFKDDPVMPGCLGLDAMWQLTGFFLGWTGLTGKGRALGVKEVKFTGQVLPTNKLIQYRIDIKRIIQRKMIMAISCGRLQVDGKTIYTAENMRVGLFSELDLA